MSMISELINELRIRADVEGRGTINEHLMTKAADTIEMLSEKVREPKRGEWIGDKCSVCGRVRTWCGWYGLLPNFCPDCGARMRGTDDD